MTLSSVISAVQLNLGKTSGMKTKLELNEKDLTSIIESSLRELTCFMDTPKIKTVPYQDAIDISKLKIANIINIMRAEAPIGALSGVSLDPFALSGTVAVNPGKSSPGIHNILQTQMQYAARMMAQQTVQEELSYITDLYSQKLYVTYAGMRPNQITIIYKPIVEKVEDLPSDHWTNYLIRLATAHGRIIIGQLRVKYSVPNSPMSVNGESMLDQGKEELQEIREELKSMRGAVFN